MSLRWTAPEILEEMTGTTFEGDIYALGMTILETMTGEVPYFETVNESALVLRIARQESLIRPEAKIPPNDTRADMLWALMTSCWSYNPDTRPKATEVRDTVNESYCIGGKYMDQL
ncbi:kinase-like domain-containing protein [Rhizoctonia solani]|nr:kinase-like domain-containing protein [Rhizoctonia solani]